MQWIIFSSALGMSILAGVHRDGSTANSQEPIWLKDYAQARQKALREDRPIFVVFR
jgi:hypothetical protein